PGRLMLVLAASMADGVKSEAEAEAAAARARMALLPVAALILYVLVLVRMAWVSDDAFITLRALDNLRHGYGLVSNPPDRVLGFTNPLWAFVMFLPLALSVNVYWTALLCGLVTSFIVALLLVRRLPSDPNARSLGVLWLALSAAYIDFSTSGLENP